MGMKRVDPSIPILVASAPTKAVVAAWLKEPIPIDPVDHLGPVPIEAEPISLVTKVEEALTTSPIDSIDLAFRPAPQGEILLIELINLRA